MRKKLFIILSIALIFTCFGLVYADGEMLVGASTPVSYIDIEKNSSGEINYLKSQTWWYTKVTSTTSSLAKNTCYYVDTTTKISTKLEVGENVKLILKDGVTLTVTGGIKVVSGGSLTIYSQSYGQNMGTLIATVTNTAAASGHAGIGGSDTDDAGDVIINGGNIFASGDGGGAGIGGGNNHNAGKIIINAGTVKAMAGASAPSAIGAGNGKTNATIEIANGLTVKARDSRTSGTLSVVSGDKLTNKKYVEISHVHNYTHTQSGDVIITKCTNCYSIDKSGVVLEFSAKDADWTGKAYTGAKVSGDSWKTMIGGGKLPDIYYEGVSPTLYNSNKTAPTNAGTYRAKITIGATSYYVNFEIKKVDATYSGDKRPTAKTSLKFTGSNQDLVNAGIAIGGKIVYKFSGDDDSKYSTTIKATDAGKYIICYKISGDQNHNDSGDGVIDFVEIQKVDAEYTSGKKPTAISSLVYNGKKQNLVNAGQSVEDTKILYKISGDSSFSGEIPQAKDAGEYIVCYKISGDKNHNDSGDGTVKVTIGKMPVTVTADNIERNFGTAITDADLTWSHSSLGSGDPLTNITLTIKNKDTKVGKYEIVVSSGEASDNPNYDITCVNGTLTINPRVVLDANGGIFNENSGDKYTLYSRYNESVSGERIKEPVRSGYEFAMWCTDKDTTTTWNPSQVLVDNLNLYARWEKLSNNVSIIVSGEKNAEVELRTGNTLFVSGETVSSGECKFTNVPNGNYRLIVTKGTRTIEESLSVQDNITYTIELPLKSAVALVEVSGDMHDTSVTGLNELAKEKESGDADVRIVMSVEEVEATDPEVSSILAIASGKEIEFIDVDITYYVSGELQGEIHETPNILEINIEYPTEDKNIYVYRTHSGETQQLTRIYSRDDIADGRFMVNNGYITIFTSKFSTYAIAYTDIEEIVITGSRKKYAIELDTKIKNGELELSSETAYKGKTVTVNAVPDDGYEVSKVVVKDSKENSIKVTKGKDGKYSFTMPESKVLITASFKKVEEEDDDGSEWVNPYIDVKASDWFYDSVKFVDIEELFNGTSANTFSPDMNMTREMIVTVFYRYAKKIGMDVSVGEDTNILSYDDASLVSEYAIPAMQWAVGAGIINGRTETTLVPQGTVTRQEFVTILYRLVKLQGKGFTGTWMFNLDVADRAAIGDWAYESICWCYMNKIIVGKNGNVIDPTGLAKRSEVATMMMRFLSL